MLPDEFEQQIQAAQQHLLELHQCTRQLPISKTLLAGVVAELSIALEGLSVTTEELHLQNQELLVIPNLTH